MLPIAKMPNLIYEIERKRGQREIERKRNQGKKQYFCANCCKFNIHKA
jgi:hypothetical protein